MDSTIKNYILEHCATIQDYPKPGIVFKDLNPILNKYGGLQLITDNFITILNSIKNNSTTIVGIESRGFIFGSAIVQASGRTFCSRTFVPVRKSGKLPPPVNSIEYSLEYGSGILEIPKYALTQSGYGVSTIIVDDVLATGGTVAATKQLIEKSGGTVSAILTVLELSFLKARELESLKNTPIYSLCSI